MLKKFKDYYADRNIKQDFAFVYHPQTNGHVERANRLVLGGIKARLVKSQADADGKWIDHCWRALLRPSICTMKCS